jgi:hypothetical protein
MTLAANKRTIRFSKPRKRMLRLRLPIGVIIPVEPTHTAVVEGNYFNALLGGRLA